MYVNGKIMSVEIFRNGGKENGRGGELKYDILDIL
jgi:hypothetical protein